MSKYLLVISKILNVDYRFPETFENLNPEIKEKLARAQEYDGVDQVRVRRYVRGRVWRIWEEGV